MICPRCGKPIDDHEAGRETDACVAEVVFGGPAKRREWYWWNGTSATAKPIISPALLTFVPKFSTDIAAAWEVVEKGHWFDAYFIFRYGSGYAIKRLGRPAIPVFVEAPTASLAICRAALKASGPKAAERITK